LHPLEQTIEREREDSLRSDIQHPSVDLVYNTPSDDNEECLKGCFEKDRENMGQQRLNSDRSKATGPGKDSFRRANVTRNYSPTLRSDDSGVKSYVGNIPAPVLKTRLTSASNRYYHRTFETQVFDGWRRAWISSRVTDLRGSVWKKGVFDFLAHRSAPAFLLVTIL
jgi:hypothetical protein